MDVTGAVTWAEIGWTLVYGFGCGIVLLGLSAAWESLQDND